MIEWTALLVPATIALLLSLVILPASQANRYPRLLRRWVTALLAIQSVSVLLLAIEAAVVGGLPISFACFGSRAGWGQLSTIYIDPVSILMLLMVSTVSFVVSRFSIRYLDGETSQGSYFRWLAFTTAAVSTMVVAGNLLLFFAAWVMTSAGLHRLLLHYGHREAAQQAAWTKVTISRIGDGFLLAAVVLTVRTFGTGDFAELFERATAVAEGGQVTMAHQAIAWLLVIAAALKSAQFPFHTWLPNTMETPTPVSALMHAGIVNAGGLSGDPRQQAHCPGSRNPGCPRRDWGGDCLFRGSRDDDSDQCQTSPRVLDDRTDGIHDAAVRFGGFLCCHASHLGPLFLQGERIPHFGKCVG